MVWVVLALAAACGGEPNKATPEDPGPGPDAGGIPTGGDGGVDGGVDADPGDPGPFPSNPKGGEFAWVVSTPGAGDTVKVAVDRQGSIFVVARQTGDVSLGSVHVPGPTGGKGLLVLKLTGDGQPIWGRTVASAYEIYASSLAITQAGDAVIGGKRRTSSASAQDGFVMVVDGGDGATRWTRSLTSHGSGDHVAGIAVGPDATGAGAIYAYGQLDSSVVIDGRMLAAGAYLVRFDEDGAWRWAQSFPTLNPGYDDSLALDPQRGPVITGKFHGELRLGNQVLTAAPDRDGYASEDAVVAGFDPDGNARFGRQIFSEYTSFAHNVAVAPGGDVYLATDTSGTETVVHDHTIPTPDLLDHPLLLRLTPEGEHAFSTVISGRRPGWSDHVTTDAAGAVYLLGTCEGQVDVQPEITCAGRGGVVVSYGADNEYRWATYVTPAFLEAIAPAPGNRLIVAGQALSGMLDLGGVRVPSEQLFIAALAGGPPRLPSPLPAAPAISSVRLDGMSDREIRQGDTRTLVIEGAGLDRVTRARLGDIEVHIPAAAGTAGELRLPVMIPHGHAPGWLDLTLGNTGGSTQIAAAVQATPLVVSLAGSDDGRGTFASPMRMCTPDLFLMLRYGDTLLLRDGVHVCDRRINVRPGVIIRGESKAGTIVRGSGSGFGVLSGRLGAMAVESLTIEPSFLAAITLFGGRAVVTDVDVRSASASGIWVERGAVATVRRYRYRQGQGTGIVIFGGSVDASEVEVEEAYRGVLMDHGTLKLADSSLSSDYTAVEAGDLNTYYGTREVAISRTTLRSKSYALTAAAARVTIADSTLEPVAGTTGAYGITLYGGALTLTDSVVRGWGSGCIYTWLLVGDTMSLALDRDELTTCATGIVYDAGLDGRFSLRGSKVQVKRGAAVTLYGRFAEADLGTAASPGDNELETTGDPALEDRRMEAGPAVDAHGTLLNGMTLEGDVPGPASAPGAYNIRGPNTIRF